MAGHQCARQNRTPTDPVNSGDPVNHPHPAGFSIFNKEPKHRANTHGYAYSGDKATKTYLSKKPAGWSFKGTPMLSQTPGARQAAT